MLRRVALVTFGLAIALVVACGRQVTPDSSLDNSNLAGRMVVKFRTAGPLNFNTFTYAIVVDTCGGGTPYPDAFATTFNNYSFAFLIGGIYGTAIPTLEQYIITSGTGNSLNPQTVPLGASTTQLVTNSNQQNNEFQLTFVREQLNNPLQVARPCPNITPAPGSPTVSPGVSPTATATATATGGASPVATLTPVPAPPNAVPTTFNQTFWYFNFFTIDNATKTVQDSLGIGGSRDNTFNGIGIDTNVTQPYAIFKAGGGTIPSDPAAQLQGGEIDNFL